MIARGKKNPKHKILVFALFSNEWYHRGPSMPSLVKSHPTAASLRPEPREELTTRWMCNLPSLWGRDHPEISGSVSSICSLSSDDRTSPLLSLTLSLAILRSNMPDDSSEDRGKEAKEATGEHTEIRGRAGLGSGRTKRHMRVCQH